MKMNRVITFFVILLTITFTSCSKDVVVDVDGEKLTKSEFDKLYYAQLKQNYGVKTNEEVDKIASNPNAKKPILDKAKFLDQYIEHMLMAKLAKESGVFDNENSKSLIKFLEEGAVAGYYTKVTVIDLIKVTDKEIEEEYNKNRARFKNAPFQKVRDYIETYIKTRKFQEESQKIVKDMQEKSKIEKNLIVLQQLSDQDKSKRPKDGWVAKINGETLSVKEFENIYYQQFSSVLHIGNDEIDKLAKDPANLRANPLLDKKEFLEQIISQKLIYDKAKEDKLLENPEVQLLVKVQTEMFMIGYYVKEKYKSDLQVTEAEIEEVYNQYKNNYRGVPFDQVQLDIKRRLLGMKFSNKMAKLIQEQKEKLVIKKNLELLKSEKKDNTDKTENK